MSSNSLDFRTHWQTSLGPGDAVVLHTKHQSMTEQLWYPRLADIPGVEYEPAQGVDRTTIRGWDSTPEIRMYRSGIDGQELPALDWGDRELANEAWESLNSPVSEYLATIFVRKRASTKAVLRRVYEGLELPGTPDDYAYALSRTLDSLWARRRVESGWWDEFERLALVELRLGWLYPDRRAAPYAEQYGTPAYRRPRAMSLLVMMYRTEGYLDDALSLLEEEQRWFPDAETHDLDDIRARLEVLDTEAAS